MTSRILNPLLNKPQNLHKIPEAFKDSNDWKWNETTHWLTLYICRNVSTTYRPSAAFTALVQHVRAKSMTPFHFCGNKTLATASASGGVSKVVRFRMGSRDRCDPSMKPKMPYCGRLSPWSSIQEGAVLATYCIWMSSDDMNERTEASSSSMLL